MSKSRRYNKTLNKIININEDCSEDTSEEDQYELGQSEDDSESSVRIESEEIEESRIMQRKASCIVTRKECVFFLVLTPRMRRRAFQAHFEM